MNYLLLFLFIVAEIAFVICTFSENAQKAIWFRNRFLINALLSIICIALSLIPSFIFKDYHGRETTGSYEVAMSEAILSDSSRLETFENDGSFREVPVHFYYPDTDELTEFPLIIFSHGAFGYYESNTSTYMELASNGYVVVSLDHPYHSFFCTDTDGKTIIVDMKFMNDVMYINSGNATEQEIAELIGRIRDDVDAAYLSGRPFLYGKSGRDFFLCHECFNYLYSGSSDYMDI